MSEKEVEIIETKLNDLKLEFQELKTNMDWILKFFWIMTSAVIVNTIGLIFILIRNHI